MARDDELAAQMEILEKDDDSESPHKSPVKIELAVSEIKSFTRIGSDEDDEGDDDEVQSADDVSETAVSRDIHNEVAANNGNASPHHAPDTAASPEEEEEEEIEEEIEAETDNDDNQDNATADADADPSLVVLTELSDATGDSASGEVTEAGGDSLAGGAVMNGEVGRLLQVYSVYLYGVPTPPVHDEEENGNIITVDDLPAKLTGLTMEDPALEEKRAAEDQLNSGVAAALEVLDGAAASPGGELAGDPAALKDPDVPSPTVEFHNDNVLYLTAPDGSTIMTPGMKFNESNA